MTAKTITCNSHSYSFRSGRRPGNSPFLTFLGVILIFSQVGNLFYLVFGIHALDGLFLTFLGILLS